MSKDSKTHHINLDMHRTSPRQNKSNTPKIGKTQVPVKNMQSFDNITGSEMILTS